MPRYDIDIILRLISELRKNVRRLQILSDLKKEEIIDDPDKIAVIVHRGM